MLRHLVPLALAVTLGSASTCTQETSGSPQTPPPPASGTGSAALGPPAVDETKCVDAWLEQHGLDPYGNKAGTMYAGGTPLFDEATGKTTDRLQIVYQGHPEAKAACHK